jgi:hypothetical protein
MTEAGVLKEKTFWQEHFGEPMQQVRLVRYANQAKGSPHERLRECRGCG